MCGCGYIFINGLSSHASPGTPDGQSLSILDHSIGPKVKSRTTQGTGECKLNLPIGAVIQSKAHLNVHCQQLFRAMLYNTPLIESRPE